MTTYTPQDDHGEPPVAGQAAAGAGHPPDLLPPVDGRPPSGGGASAPPPGDPRKLRDEGMERVLRGTPPAYKDAFTRQVSRMVLVGATFTAEDITTVVGRPRSQNSVGALLSGLKRRGLIQEVGYEQAERSERHASRMLRWKGKDKELARTILRDDPGRVSPLRVDVGEKVEGNANIRRLSREGKPDQYVNLRRVEEERAQAARDQARAEEVARLKATPRVRLSARDLSIGDRLCRSCQGTGGNMVDMCYRCSGTGKER